MSKRWLQKELANTANDPNRGIIPAYGGYTRLLPQDNLLATKGGSGLRAMEIYTDLLTDSHILAVLEKQFLDITSRPWYLEAASDLEIDIKAKEYCEKCLLELGSHQSTGLGDKAVSKTVGGFDELTRHLLFAYFLGYTVAEVVWASRGDGYVYPEAIIGKDVRRFGFYVDYDGTVYPKLYTKDKAFEGEFLPTRKFIFHTSNAVPVEDPYGSGVARQCYYPVKWKREALSMWLQLLDKHVDPTAVLTYPERAGDDKVTSAFSAISNIAQETAIAFPEGFELEFKERDLKNAESILELVKYCDNAISMAILGEQTTGVDMEGSLARDKISNSIRITKAKSLSDFLSFTLSNTLLLWITELNFPGAKPPKVWRDFSDGLDVTKLISDIASLDAIGYKVDKAFIAEKTSLPMAKPKPKAQDILAQQQSLGL